MERKRQIISMLGIDAFSLEIKKDGMDATFWIYLIFSFIELLFIPMMSNVVFKFILCFSVLLILPIYFWKRNIKKRTSLVDIFFFDGITTFFASLTCFCPSIFLLIEHHIVLSWVQITLYILLFLPGMSFLIFRQRKVKFIKKKNGGSAVTIVPSVGAATLAVALTPFLKSFLRQFNVEWVISSCWIIVGIIIMFISLMNLQSFLIGKKEKIDTVFCQSGDAFDQSAKTGDGVSV